MTAPGVPECCGLSLDSHSQVPLGQPLAAVVILKTLEEGGEISVGYHVMATGALATVEALGMAHYAVRRLTRALDRSQDAT